MNEAKGMSLALAGRQAAGAGDIELVVMRLPMRWLANLASTG